MEEVEDIVEVAISGVLLERCLQFGKARNAVLVFDHGLAVEERRLGGQVRNRLGEVRKFFGPVETLARQQPDLAVIEPRLQPVAIELDFVHPARVAGWPILQGRQRGWDEVRQWRAVALGLGR